MVVYARVKGNLDQKLSHVANEKPKRLYSPSRISGLVLSPDCPNRRPSSS